MNAVESKLSSCLICREVFDAKTPELIGHIAGKVHHIFHEDCLISWIRQNPNCPICRVDLTEHNFLRLPNPNLSWKDKIIYWKNKKISQAKAALGVCKHLIGATIPIAGQILAASMVTYGMAKLANSALELIPADSLKGLVIGSMTVLTAASVAGITQFANKILGGLAESNDKQRLQQIFTLLCSNVVAMKSAGILRTSPYTNSIGTIIGAGTASGAVSFGSLLFILYKCGFSPFGVLHPELMDYAMAVKEGGDLGALVAGFIAAMSLGVLEYDSKFLAMILGAIGTASAAAISSNFPCLVGQSINCLNRIVHIIHTDYNVA